MATQEEIRRAKFAANPNYSKYLDPSSPLLGTQLLKKGTDVIQANTKAPIALAQEGLGNNNYGDPNNKDDADWYARHPYFKQYDIHNPEHVKIIQNEYNRMRAERGLPPYFFGEGIQKVDGLRGDWFQAMPAFKDRPQQPTPELRPNAKFPDLIPIVGNTALGLYGLDLANKKMPPRPGQPVFSRDNVLNTELANAQVRSQMLSPQMLREMNRSSAGRMQAATNNAAAASGGQAGSFASNVQQAAVSNADQKLKDLMAAEQMRLANQQAMQNLMAQRGEETGRLQGQAFHRSDQDLEDYRQAVRQANNERQFGRQMAVNNFTGALSNLPTVIEGFQKRSAAKKLRDSIDAKERQAKENNELADKAAEDVLNELNKKKRNPFLLEALNNAGSLASKQLFEQIMKNPKIAFGSKTSLR